MAIDYGATNEARYHSAPYSPAFDLPNADWSILALYKLASSADTPYVVSAGGGFGAANSYHIYHSSGVGRLKIATLSAAVSGFTVPLNEYVFLYATRRDGFAYCGAGAIDDPSTWVEGSGVSISSAYVPSATDLKIGIRADRTSSATDALDGVVSDVIFSNAPLSMHTIIDSLFAVTGAKRFYANRVLHFYGETAQSAGFTDLLGRHIFTRNGTGYGGLEQDPAGFSRFPARRSRSVFLPLFAGGASAELSGSAIGNASSSGSITTDIPLTGAAVVIATAMAEISTSIDLIGAAVSISNASGNLDASITLSGASIAQALAGAGLDTQILLAGLSSGQATSAGDLDTQIPLQGDVVGQSTASATLTAQITLSGAAIAQALATGALDDMAAQLSGQATGQASASGALSSGITLVGDANAVVTGAGDLSAGISLQGVAVSQATATGDIAISFTLEGNAIALVLAGGTLTTQIPLVASALSIVGATGDLAMDAPAGNGYVAARVSGISRQKQEASNRLTQQSRNRPTYH